jgi:hypothetical protein
VRIARHLARLDIRYARLREMKQMRFGKGWVILSIMAGFFQPVRTDWAGAAIMLVSYTMNWLAALKTRDVEKGKKLSTC